MSARPPGPSPRRQAGAALVVALIFLVVLTVLGVAMLGNNTLQTRMAYGSGETNLAFQSAETALASGENWLYQTKVRPTAGCATGNGPPITTYTATANCNQDANTAAYIWPRPDPSSTVTPPVGKDQFFDDSWWTSNGRKFGWTYVDNVTPAIDSTQSFASGSDVPRYVVEEIGSDPTGEIGVGAGLTYRVYYYQVTARAYGLQADTTTSKGTRTVVQSVYGQGY